MLRLYTHAAGLHDNGSINMCSAHNIHYDDTAPPRAGEISPKYENYFVRTKHLKFISTFVCCARKLCTPAVKEAEWNSDSNYPFPFFTRCLFFGDIFLVDVGHGFVFVAPRNREKISLPAVWAANTFPEKYRTHANITRAAAAFFLSGCAGGWSEPSFQPCVWMLNGRMDVRSLRPPALAHPLSMVSLKSSAEALSSPSLCTQANT